MTTIETLALSVSGTVGKVENIEVRKVCNGYIARIFGYDETVEVIIGDFSDLNTFMEQLIG